MKKTEVIQPTIVAKNDFIASITSGNSIIQFPDGIAEMRLYKKGILVCTTDYGYYGVYSYTGNIIVPAVYDYITLYETGIVVEKDELFGVFSYEGKNIVPIQFSYITLYDSVILTGKRKALEYFKGLYSYTGQCIVPTEFDKFALFTTEVMVHKGQLYGLYSTNGNLLVPPEFDTIELYEDAILVYKKNHSRKKSKHVGAYSLDGELIIPVEFDDIYLDRYGLIVYKDILCGLYTYDGTLILPIEFEYINFCGEDLKDLYVVTKNDLKGVYLKEKCIIPVEFDDINIYSDSNVILVFKNDLYGAYSIDGTHFIPCEYEDISFLDETGTFKVTKAESKNVQWQICDSNNN